MAETIKDLRDTAQQASPQELQNATTAQQSSKLDDVAGMLWAGGLGLLAVIVLWLIARSLFRRSTVNKVAHGAGRAVKTTTSTLADMRDAFNEGRRG
jgi:flagellar biosynthesis/type III secretory pathway M-ring protein FliF/YscJ